MNQLLRKLLNLIYRWNHEWKNGSWAELLGIVTSLRVMGWSGRREAGSNLQSGVMNGSRGSFSVRYGRGLRRRSMYCSTAAIGAVCDLILCTVPCHEPFSLSLSIWSWCKFCGYHCPTECWPLLVKVETPLRLAIVDVRSARSLD